MEQTEAPKKSALERLEELEGLVQSLTEQNKANLEFQENVKNIVKEFQDAFNMNFEQAKRSHEEFSYNQQHLAERIEAASTVVTSFGETLAAIISVIEEKKIFDTSLVGQKMLVARAEKRLKQEEALIAQGLLKEGDVAMEDSMLVVSHKDVNGNVITQRDHINLSALESDNRVKFVGVRAGDVVKFDKVSVEIIKVLNPVVSSEERSESNG